MDEMTGTGSVKPGQAHSFPRFDPRLAGQMAMDEMTGTESVKPGQGSETHSFLRFDPLAGQTALWNSTQGCEDGAVLAEPTNYLPVVQR